MSDVRAFDTTVSDPLTNTRGNRLDSLQSISSGNVPSIVPIPKADVSGSKSSEIIVNDSLRSISSGSDIIMASMATRPTTGSRSPELNYFSDYKYNVVLHIPSHYKDIMIIIVVWNEYNIMGPVMKVMKY